jgi:polyhydroxybutyrate depolymerase
MGSLAVVASLVLGCSSTEPSEAAGAGAAAGGTSGAGGVVALGGGGQTAAGSSAGGAIAGASLTGGAMSGGAGGASLAGSGGAAAAGSGGVGGSPADVKSIGCGKPAPADLTPEMFVRKSLPDVAKTSKGALRVYEVRVPKDYDMNRAYPVVFESHGCDGSIPFKIEEVTKSDAIIVAPRAGDNQDNNYMGGCFQAGANGPGLGEIPYFDAVVTSVEMNLCVNRSKLFMEGYSSGSWLTNMLGCTRAKTLRGQGNATGGLPPNTPKECEGPIAAMMVHDDNDTMNPIAGGIEARDRIRAINGCSDQTLPYVWDTNPATPSVCVEYQGCKPGFPVVWCATHNKGHSDGKPMTTVGLWKFWSSLP